MVSYVERATLQVKDAGATKAARKINRELRKVLKTAQALERQGKKLGKIDVAIRGADKARRDLDGVATALRGLRSKSVNLSVTGKGLAELARADAALRKLPASRTIRLNAVLGGKGRSDLNALLARKPLINIRPNLIKRAEFENELNKLLKARTVPVSVVPQPGPNNQPRRPQPEGFREGFVGEFERGRAGSTTGRATVYDLQSEAYIAARQAFVAAASAPLAQEEAENRVLAAGRTEDELEVLKGISDRLTDEFQNIPAAEILGNAIETTGSFGDLTLPENAEMAEQSMRRMVESASQLVNIFGLSAEAAADQARLIEKSIQITGAAADPERAARLQRAALQASIASGGDLLPAEVVRSLQQLDASFVAGLSDEALLQVALARDEGGRSSTANFRTAFQDLTRGNLNQDDREAQIAAGFRDEQGRANEAAQQFQQDPFAFVADEIVPRLEAAGIEVTEANAAQVNAFIDEILGFTTTGSRYLTATAVQLEERRRELDRARRADPSAARPTVRSEAQAVSAQFQNVANEALSPLLPTVRTGLDLVSDALNSVSDGDFGTLDVATLAAGAAGAGLGASLLAMQNEATRPLGAAGLSLTTAGIGLNAAAAALTGAAGVAALGGKGARAGLVGLAVGLAGKVIKNPITYAIAAAAAHREAAGYNAPDSADMIIDNLSVEGVLESRGAAQEDLTADEQTRAADIVGMFAGEIAKREGAGDIEGALAAQTDMLRALEGVLKGRSFVSVPTIEVDPVTASPSEALGPVITGGAGGDVEGGAGFDMLRDIVREVNTTGAVVANVIEDAQRAAEAVEPEIAVLHDELTVAPDDFERVLTTPVGEYGDVMTEGAGQVGEAVSSGAGAIGERIEAALDTGGQVLADRIVRALEGAGIDITSEPAMAPVDTGRSAPF